MWNSFPYVIQGDCTHNTNCYGLAFLQVLGFTYTGKNFTIAYAFLQHELEDNYTWTLQHVRSLFQKDKLPLIIYIDRDRAFLRAMKHVFPGSAHHFYRRHIEVNFRKHALKITGSKKFSEGYMRRFNEAISAPDVEVCCDV
ncbi:hypothetical protein LIER_28804 [Lithospermum erythrorhizon]|uniref:MULE transposase domain-containing protein n=1 Tax=Lithospermum erythrorhizon TaxID=34254 RepID=A0AAV3RMY1_LITER